MNLNQFLAYYSSVVAVVLFCSRQLFAHNWVRMLRILGFLVPTCFIADSVAEQRHFWRFPRTSGLLVLYVPLENFLFTITTVVLILVPFLQARCFVHNSRRQRSN